MYKTSLNTDFPTSALILNSSGNVSANFTISLSKNGVRASRDTAMLVLSTFVKISVGKYPTKSFIIMRSIPEIFGSKL